MKKYGVCLLVIALLTALLAGCAKEPPQEPPAEPPVAGEPEGPAAQPDGEEPEGGSEPDLAPLDEWEITLYLPDDQAEGFREVPETVPATPQSLVDALIAHGALPEGTVVNEFHLENDGVEVREGDMVSYTPGDETTVRIDLSEEFRAAAGGSGTAGETMLLGSLVNTLLGAYDADAVSLTCGGDVLETGHNVYDAPLTFIDPSAAAE